MSPAGPSIAAPNRRRPKSDEKASGRRQPPGFTAINLNAGTSITQTIWRSLLWREWHEHKWKLASLAAIMLSMEAVAIWGDPQFVTLDAPVSAFFGVAPLAIFVAMGSAAGERTAGTLAFARSLPANRSLLAASKLTAGVATLLASIALASLLPLVWLVIFQWKGSAIHESPFKGFGPFESLVLSGLLAAGVAASCFAWAVALGVNKASEIRAGLSGAGLLLVAVLFRALDAKFRLMPEPTFASRLLRSLNEIGPLGLTLLLEPLASPLRVVALQLAAWASLTAWTLRRYGRTEDLAPSSSGAGRAFWGGLSSSNRTFIRPACQTMLGALVWKQAREAAPFCLSAAVSIACLSAWVGMMDLPKASLEELLTVITIGAAMLTGLLIGIGTFIGELQERVLEFWRSRPIRPALWFWAKYFTGLAASALFLAIPIAASGQYGRNLAMAFLPWLAIVYSLAVCLTCLVRHSFYAGVLSFTLGLFLLVFSTARKAWLNPASFSVVLYRSQELTFADWLVYVYVPYFAITASVAAAIALAAWQAVKRDLGSHRIGEFGAGRPWHAQS